jgi:V8-like Glu-specific endopeptidase
MFMQFTLIRFAFCAGLGILTQRLWSHHAFSAEFDAKQSTTFGGVVTKVEWTNPHVYFYADVKEKDGRTANWAFETAGPNSLTRLGWNRNSLKIGDHVTVVGYPARDGAKVASARSVLLANGRKVFAGSALDGGPEP